MATVKFYLDTRRRCVDGTYPLKLSVSHRGRNTLLTVPGVRLSAGQWDGVLCRVKGHPLHRRLTNAALRYRMEVEDKLLSLQMSGELAGMGIGELRAALLGRDKKPTPLFTEVYEQFAASRPAEGTRDIYRQTLRRIRAYCPGCGRLTFDAVTVEWLAGFEAFLSRTCGSANARGVHLRNIRAVFNHAISTGITANYPFSRYRIKSQPTPKRSLPVESLRELFALELEPWQQKYLDIFKLIFFLCGINIGDLCKLREVRYGRVEYVRAKTHRPYSIKVEPEAMEIIEKYRGRLYLLDILDTYKTPHDFMHRMNKNLKSLGGVRGEERWPGLTTYWARHSWATTAASLDIPKETIAAALGHAQNSVTDVYIAFDRRKIDAANRRVIDYVLGGL